MRRISLTFILVIGLIGCSEAEKVTKKPEVSRPSVTKPTVAPTPRTYDQAIGLANELGRPMLLIFTSRHCEPCRIMESAVWSNRDVKQKLKRFVVFKVNVDSQKWLANRFDVRVLPTYMIVSKKEKILRIGSGQRTVTQISRWLE